MGLEDASQPDRDPMTTRSMKSNGNIHDNNHTHTRAGGGAWAYDGFIHVMKALNTNR